MDILLQGQISALKNGIATQTENTAASNTYTLDLGLSPIKNFSIETTDANAKIIAFGNVPSGFVQITVKLKYTNAAAITYPAGVVWEDGAIPVFTATKTYFIMFVTDDGGVTWLGSYVGAW